MAEVHPRIVGMGRKTPKGVRYNGDKIFDWLREHPETPGQDLFSGFHARHFLSPDETLTGIMVSAAQAALADAHIGPGDVDLLLGAGSISTNATPNILSLVHRELGLDHRVWTLPLMNSFSQAPAAIFMADALIQSSRCETALLVFGSNWTQCVSYRTPQAISASDAAAALVLRRSDAPSGWRLVDQLCFSDTSYYGSMEMRGKVIPGVEAPVEFGLQDVCGFAHPSFQINELGFKGFNEIGKERAPQVVKELLARHGVAPQDMCLISHQASSVLTKYWHEQIKPGHYVDTLWDYANMVLCSVPFNLSYGSERGEIAQDWLVLLCLGPDMHVNAMLLRRD